MRFKKRTQLPRAGRTRAGHHHGSHTPTSPGAILLSKMACQPKMLAPIVSLIKLSGSHGMAHSMHPWMLLQRICYPRCAIGSSIANFPAIGSIHK